MGAPKKIAIPEYAERQYILIKIKAVPGDIGCGTGSEN